MARVTVTYTLDSNGDPQPTKEISLRQGDFLVFNTPLPTGVTGVLAQMDGPLAALAVRDRATATAIIDGDKIIVSLTPIVGSPPGENPYP